MTVTVVLQNLQNPPHIYDAQHVAQSSACFQYRGITHPSVPWTFHSCHCDPLSRCRRKSWWLWGWVRQLCNEERRSQSLPSLLNHTPPYRVIYLNAEVAGSKLCGQNVFWRHYPELYLIRQCHGFEQNQTKQDTAYFVANQMVWHPAVPVSLFTKGVATVNHTNSVQCEAKVMEQAIFSKTGQIKISFKIHWT